jgi:CRISPR/Cas system-associated exonuclease Cas4 (RecB family)
VSGSRIAIAPANGSQSASLKRAEVRDVLAWMRLLIDPQDAAAVVRALSRPPIELRQVELARVIQVARRRKLDLVGGLAAATESPQVPPEARERIQRFVELHRSAAAELDTLAPDAFLARLIERLGVRGRPLLAPEDAAEQRASLELLRRLAVEFVRSTPNASIRDLARHLATVVPDGLGEDQAIEQSPATPIERSEAGDPQGDGDHANAHIEDQDPIDEEPVDELHATFQLLREEVLEGVARIGGRLGELRLDTDLDISHGVVRYLELLKLSALLQRPDGQGLGEALADVNQRLLAAATPLQREIFQTSTLDETLSASEGGGSVGGVAGARARAKAIAPREQHSLDPFLPRKGAGLALSASDIFTYRSCPLRYKYARVLRIPTEQTVHQRFGIVVHQVLERYHADGGETLAQMLALLDSGWRRAGFPFQGRCGESERDRELFDKARAALVLYHARLAEERSQPVWFERQFSFRLGPHHLRGRVDRVDRIGGVEPTANQGKPVDGAGARYELIDYKTSRPKSAEQLRDDVQLSLYALAAREDWGLESSQQAYYYVLDDLKVPVQRGERDAAAVKDVVLEVGDGILAQEFEPTPSRVACGMCDYRIVCPAAEA